MKKLLIVLSIFASSSYATDVTIQGNTYTLPGHPRVFLDGPSGTITARVKDPDGMGPLVAPQAFAGNPPYDAILAYRSCRAAPEYCRNEPEIPAMVLNMALDWYMDNTQTLSLECALAWINTAEAWLSPQEFACDVATQYCAQGSNADWISERVIHVAQAYSIVRSEMSAQERTDFADKMFHDDINGYQDNCTNQLTLIPGASATWTTGGLALTGTGLSGMTNGREIYLKKASNWFGWSTTGTVNSDTSVTMTEAVQGPHGGNVNGTSGAAVYEIAPWTNDSCGYAWLSNHHEYSPGDVMNRLGGNLSAYTNVATTITATGAGSLPTVPFYISVPNLSEFMKVTNIAGSILTVERAQFGSVAVANVSSARPYLYTKYIPKIGTLEYINNLTLQRIFGHIAAAIATADDSEEARVWVGTAANSWLNNMLPKIKDHFTGFQGGGSSNYGSGRLHTQQILTALMLRNIPGSPSLDKTSGQWLQNMAESWLYTMTPNAPSVNLPWGVFDTAIPSNYRGHQWAPAWAHIFGVNTDSAKYWNYWQRTITSNYTASGLSTGGAERIIPWALFWFQQSDPSTDYRTIIPTQKVFNVNDGNPNAALSYWVSRTGFSSSTDTYLMMAGYSVFHTSDHLGCGQPGAFKIYKLGWTLTEHGLYNTGCAGSTNYIFFGVSSLLAGLNLQVNKIEREASGTGWAHIRNDAKAAYTTAAAITRALRTIIHFKKAGQSDFIVSYDTAATTVAKRIGSNYFYDEGGSITHVLPDIQWTGSNRRINAKVVTPTGTDVAKITGVNQYGLNVFVCKSTDGTNCANVTSAEFLLVHKPAANIFDTMPTIAALSTIDSDFSGVQIQDSGAPSVAVFSKLGVDQTSGSFTTTHPGTAQYVISGLGVGSYDVVRDGVALILDDQAVGTNGVLAFESIAGAFTIQEGTAPPPSIEITTTSLPNHVEDVAGYSQQLTYTGGTGAVTWTLDSGTWCAGITMNSAGLVSGTPTTQQTCNVVVKVTDSLAQFDTQALSITITAPPPACIITTTNLGDGTRNVAYSQTLATSGCTAPLLFTVLSGTLCTGLSLNDSTGAITGIPSVVQMCSITFKVVDDDAEEDTADLSITINAPAPEILNIITTTPLPNCIQFQPCSTAFAATGGVPPFTWSKASGTYCVGNSSLDVNTGVLSGNPTVVETCTFTMQVQDSASPTPVTDTQEFQRTIVNHAPNLNTSVIRGSTGVIVKFSTPGLDNEQDCDITVSDEEIDPNTNLPYGPIANATSTGGPSVRVVPLDDLTAEHDHSVSVVCGSIAFGTANFTTKALVGGTKTWKLNPVATAYLQSQSVAKVTVEYNILGEVASSTTNNSCAITCNVNLTLNNDEIYGIRYIWKTAGDVVLMTTPLTYVVLP